MKKKLFFSLVCTGIIGNAFGDTNSALAYLNSMRQSSGMIDLNLNTSLSQAALNHAEYLRINSTSGHYENSGLEGYTGYSPKDRVGYTGYNGYISENVSSGQEDYNESLDGLMSAIYHRLGFLGFNINEIGLGASENKFVYDMGSSLLEDACKGSSFSGSGAYVYGVCIDTNFKIEAQNYNSIINGFAALNPKIVFWPPDNATVPPVFFEEDPDPLPDYGVSGYPISIQLNSYYYSTMTEGIVSDFTLSDSEGNKITNYRILNKENDPNLKLEENEFVLFPLDRLKWDSRYDVSAKIDGENYSWSFRTTRLDSPIYNVESYGKYNIDVKNDTKYYLYFQPQTAFDVLSTFSSASNTECTFGFYDANTVWFKVTGENGKYCELIGGDGEYDVKASIATTDFTATQSSDITLAKGWNLIAVPYAYKTTDLTKFGEFKRVYTYVNQQWYENPAEIDYGYGIWIDVEQDRVLTLQKNDTNTYKPDFQMATSGWNLVGTGEDLENIVDGTTVAKAWVWRGSKWIENPEKIYATEGFWIYKNN